MVRLDADVGVTQTLKRAQEQSSAGQQRERKRNLTRYESIANPASAARRSGLQGTFGFKRVAGVDRGGLKSRSEPKQNTSNNAGHKGEDKRHESHREGIGLRKNVGEDAAQ